jgi:DNA mismatch repair protein MutS2
LIYPDNFEQKIGFTRIREMLRENCLCELGQQRVNEMGFSHIYEEVSENLRLAEEFRQLLLFHDDFPLNHFIDCTPVLKKLRVEGTWADAELVFGIRQSLETIRDILVFFRKSEENQFPLLKKQTGNVVVHGFVLDAINAILNKQGKIKDNASPELLKIRNEIARKQSEVSKRMQQILREVQKAGWSDEDAGITIRNGRLVIPVLASSKRKIKGFVHDESATGKTAYVEPAEVFETNNEIRELEYAENREIIKILTQFAGKIRPYIDELLIAYEFMGHMDFLRAKVLFAGQVNGVLPILKNEPLMAWRDAVHPLLYLSLKKEDRKVVPLNIQLDKENRILIISGPNAGGKSVCLQTAGLLQYMLQCGLLIPAKENSEFGIFSDIFIDIGDEQSIENDLSTYSSHLLNMKNFLRNADNSSLVLIDEFGAGTEPTLGGAIAESILEGLNNKGTFGVITTHYSNLKHFAQSVPGIINGAMQFDAQHLQPLFTLEIGKPGSSFAFEIARNIGLPENVLQNASEKVGEDYITFEKHLKEISRDKRYWETKRKNIRFAEKRLEETLEKYTEELGQLNQTKKEILEKARAEANELLQNVNRQIENTIREIRESQAEKEKTKKSREQLEILRQQLAEKESEDKDKLAQKLSSLKGREEKLKKKSGLPEEPKESAIKESIEKGDKVRIFGQDVVGEVLEVTGKSIMVAFGNMITTLPEKRLERISNREFKEASRPVGTGSLSMAGEMSQKRLNFKNDLDVRGMRAEEAIEKVTRFVDDAIMLNVSKIRILHGKGNGILRQILRDYLKTYDVVKSCRDEHVDFGGAGITVVEMDN